MISVLLVCRKHLYMHACVCVCVCVCVHVCLHMQFRHTFHFLNFIVLNNKACCFRNVVPKVKLGDLRPLPEPVEEMAVEVEETPVSVYKDSLLDEHVAVNMLSALQLDEAASGNSTPVLLGERSFDDIFM